MPLENIDEKKLKMMAVVTALGAAAIGSMTFYLRYPYIESGHGYIYAAYLGACIGLAVTLRMRNLALFVLALLAAIGFQIYAVKKFDWRQTYISMAEAGQPFALEEYIDTYPTFEEHLFTFLNMPDWVRFNQQCVQPALAQQPTAARCGSVDLIQRYYNIDIIASMTAHFEKMRFTARRIQSGDMKKSYEYAQCIANKQCASVPMLPKGVDANRIAGDSEEYIGIRKAFWSLVNDSKVTEEVCALTPVCRALVNLKVIDPQHMPF